MIPVITVGGPTGQLIELRQSGEAEIQLAGGKVIPALQGQVLQGLADGCGLDLRDVAVFAMSPRISAPRLLTSACSSSSTASALVRTWAVRSDVHLGALTGDLVQGVHGEDIIHLGLVILVGVLGLLELGQGAVENGELLVDPGR